MMVVVCHCPCSLTFIEIVWFGGDLEVKVIVFVLNVHIEIEIRFVACDGNNETEKKTMKQ